jgi:hypothetical protein
MTRELAIIGNTAGAELPALVAGAGDRAALRFLEFFTVNIRNPNTREAYRRAAGAFLRWCDAGSADRLSEVCGSRYGAGFFPES